MTAIVFQISNRVLSLFAFLHFAVLFDTADENGSGTLNADETKNVIKKVCENNGYECPPDDAMDEFIAEIGGEVTFDMFCSVAVPRILALSGIEIVEDSV